MKIGVMGAGAVGCYFGARLAQAGHEVVLIGRPAHVAAINREGLRLELAGETQRVAMPASTEAAALQGAGLLLICVKSDDSEAAAAQMRPYLAPEALVVSLQNGVGNAQRLATALGREVLGAAVYVAAEMAGPGHVRHHGRGELAIGTGPGSAGLADLLNASGIPATIAEDVEAVLWTKLVLNCAYNALSALAMQPYGVILAQPDGQAVIRDIVEEALAVAAASGVALPDDMQARVLEIGASIPGQYSSTAQDLRAGKRTEIGHLNGHVVRLGAALGVPTPVNRALLVLVRLREASPG